MACAAAFPAGARDSTPRDASNSVLHDSNCGIMSRVLYNIRGVVGAMIIMIMTMIMMLFAAAQKGMIHLIVPFEERNCGNEQTGIGARVSSQIRPTLMVAKIKNQN